MATEPLAAELLRGSGCYSVIGPRDTIFFSDAALVWASFYHLIFKTDPSVMKRKWMLAHLRSAVNLFGVRMNYFSASRSQGVKATFMEPPSRPTTG